MSGAIAFSVLSVLDATNIDELLCGEALAEVVAPTAKSIVLARAVVLSNFCFMFVSHSFVHLQAFKAAPAPLSVCKGLALGGGSLRTQSSLLSP